MNEETLAHSWAVSSGGGEEKKKRACGMRHYIQYGGAEKLLVIKDPMVCSLVL